MTTDAERVKRELRRYSPVKKEAAGERRVMAWIEATRQRCQRVLGPRSFAGAYFKAESSRREREREAEHNGPRQCDDSSCFLHMWERVCQILD